MKPILRKTNYLLARTRRKCVRGLVLAVMAVTAFAAAAQSDVLLTQYWAMPSYYNPALTGSSDYLRIRAGARLQWLGIKDAPKSFLGVAESPLQIGKKRIGLGVTAMQEGLGLFSNMLIRAQVSYKFKALKGEFSIGVQPTYFNSRFKGTEVELPDDDDYHEGTDTSIPRQDLTGNAFDLTAGVSYTHKYFSVGVAGAHLLNPKPRMSTEGSESNEADEYQTELPRTLYFTASGNIPLKNTLFELQPSLLMMTEFTDFYGAITLRATYNKFLTFGAGYRWNDAVSVMVGATFKNFFLGYAYDYPVTAIRRGSSGSHELVAGYQLKLDFGGKNKNKHRSIRIM